MPVWPKAQIRHVARFAYGTSLSADDRVEGEVPVYGSNGQVDFHDRPNTGAPVIVVGRKGSYGKVSYSDVPVAAIDTTYFIDQTTTSQDLRWLYYALSVAGLDTLSQDVGVPGLSRDQAYGQRIPLPPLSTQRAIADYLDTQTGRIDALIEKKRRMVELLEERRRVEVELIFTGGSQGLPSSWDVLPLRRLCPNVTVGVVVEPSSYFEDSGVPFVHGTDIRPGSIDMANLKFMSEESNALLNKSQIYEGDVVAMRVGEPGRAAVVPRSLHRANCASILILRRSDQLSSEILCEFLNSQPGKAQIEASQNGAAQAVINVSDALGLRIPVPPRVEQDRIEKFLQRGREQVLLSTSKLNEQTALLAEKRQALITAAVTGELEIPEAA